VQSLCASHIAGLVPGRLATALAVLCADYFLIPPRLSFVLLHVVDDLQLATLALIGVLASVRSETRMRTRRRLEAVRVLLAVSLASIGDPGRGARAGREEWEGRSGG
jgi:K+-sensing histidine kinase KdpD